MADGRTETRPRCGPSGNAGIELPAMVPIASRSASTSAVTPSTSTRVSRPSHRTHDGRYPRRSTATGSSVLALHSLTRSTGWHRNVTCVSTPMVPRLPTSSRGMSKPLTFLTVGPPPFTISPSAFTKRTSSTRSRSGPCRSRRYPDNPVASMPPTVAWSERGFERALLRVRAEHLGELGLRGAGTDRDREVGRLVRDDARRARVPRSRPHGAGSRPPGACHLRPRRRRPRARTVSASSSTVVVTAIRSTRPSGTRCISPQRLPLGSTFCGLARPAGSNASRNRAWASRSAGLNTSGIASRFSSPMPCSPDSTPPAATHAARI